VDEVVVLALHHRHPGVPQPVGERVALVAQRVEAGGRDVGGRQAAQVIGQQHRDARVVPLPQVRAVVVEEPGHVVVGEEEAVGEQVPRPAPGRRVGRRVEQQLEHRPRPACLQRLQADRRGQVRTRAVPADRDRRRVRAEGLRVARGEPERGHRVLRRSGETVLRRQPVVHRQHPDLRVPGEVAAGRVVGLDAADHPAAAVEVHQQR
jgi:hypothetical protein